MMAGLRQCSNCHEENPADSRFCQYCGARMEAAATAETATAAGTATGAAYSRTLAETATDGERPVQRKPAGAASSVASPVRQSHSPAQKQLGGGGSAAADIWGPFAGYGERGHYASWLLDDLATRATDLHQAVTERFRERKVPNARGGWKDMTARGIIVERRPYYLIQRGITTVALYIGQFGRDLFISQVTYAKGPISNVRAAILAVMVLFQLYYMVGYTSSINNAIGGFSLFGGGGGGGNLAFLLCVIGPLGFVNTLLLGLALFYSVYKWLSIKDFAALLRVPPNEFQLDDIVALEKSVEETVRQSLDAIGIDSLRMPPARNYGFRDRVI